MTKVSSFRTAPVLVLFTLLAACAPLTVYYKQGASVAAMEQTLNDCKISAIRKVPPRILTRYIPPTRAPYTQCDADGNCYTYYRITSPGRHERYDANEDLRRQTERLCMAGAGYEKVSIKECDPKQVENARPLSATRTFPPLTEASCAVRLKSGRWKIVTPGAE
ncbi:hypothetical protein [Roseovarius sp. MMSF_3281]|uniref:hypothetical protein n=1 Tax=Roseovarius sp. MMSF_3281 TaxID=3046694 RepID=UPI00273F88EC|nr:hypothetical protein [Roseovarius sp. MMSF_3281]